MRKNNISKISALTLLIGVVVVTGFFYFSGCVIIPDQVLVISGGDGQEIKRTVASCGSNEVVTETGEGGIPVNNDLSILSWNSQKGAQDGFNDDLQRLAGGLDLVLLQEASLNSNLKGQLKELSRQWFLAVAFQTGEIETGILTASYASPGFSCALREPEPLLLIPKAILVTTYPLAGSEDELLVVNVHMVNFTINNNAVRRQIEAVTNLIANHQGPVIVAGDFNTWNDERVAIVTETMTKLRLLPVIFNPDNRVMFFQHTVDGVYYRGLEVTRSLSHKVSTSDHNPLEVHFRLLPVEGKS